jgi:hypothetical protein
MFLGSASSRPVDKLGNGWLLPVLFGRERKPHPVASVPVETRADDAFTVVHHMFAGKRRNLLRLRHRSDSPAVWV